MSTPATVYIVDDDPDVRDSLRTLFEASDFKVETFESAKGFLARPAAAHACLVTDVRMPDMDGLALQEELVRRGTRLPVIVMTGHADVPLAVRAMRAGAVDFVEKPFDGEALLASIGRALEESVRNLGRTSAAQEARERIGQLTERETQVLDLLVQGKPNKVIAYELDISPRTVEIHRARVMEKLHVRNLADLVRLKLAAGGPG